MPVSAASGRELATTIRKGQLIEMRASLPAFMDDAIRDGFHHPVATGEHGVHGGSLPGSHTDPSGRPMAARALMDDMTVVTHDRAIAAFGCKVLW